jgi:hypothetical protein
MKSGSPSTQVHDTTGDRPATDAIRRLVPGGEHQDDRRAECAPDGGAAEERALEEAGYGYGV